MLLSVVILLAALNGESFATKHLAAGLKPSTEAQAVAPLRKSFIQFGQMVKHETKREAWHYADYGCWCGKGGAGKVVDDIDECCKIHDGCYGDVSNVKGCKWLEGGIGGSNYYFTRYKMTNDYGCAPLSAYDDERRSIAVCKFKLCTCDTVAAKCFAKYPYHNKFWNYDQTKC